MSIYKFCGAPTTAQPEATDSQVTAAKKTPGAYNGPPVKRQRVNDQVRAHCQWLCGGMVAYARN